MTAPEPPETATDYDVIIIGAGMSGLAAGIRLAMFDRRVLILERHGKLGGLNSYYKKGGLELDVGLHAVTNYAAKGARGLPLTKLLRQLRIPHEELGLVPQRAAEIRFPDARIRYANGAESFRGGVVDAFPASVEAIDRLLAAVDERAAAALTRDDESFISARAWLAELGIPAPLVEMIMCPVCYYGSAHERDIDLDQFVIMFQALFTEGFARPREGVRRIIRLLERTYKERGGHLELKAGVQRLHRDPATNRVTTVELDRGRTYTAGAVLSTAGRVETERLLTGEPLDAPDDRFGRLAFVEAIAAVDRPTRELDIDATIIFFSTTPEFAYRCPDELVDPTSGVICMPDNYDYDGHPDIGADQPLPQPMVRVTAQANFARWRELVPGMHRYWKDDSYQATKAEVLPVLLENATAVLGADFRDHVTFTDLFTPLTVARYTSHPTGAIYGTPEKSRDGTTPVANVFLCGTDQGFLGITGAMLSGISMANRHFLQS